MRLVNLPFGTRPYKTVIDPSNDGAEEVTNLKIAVRERYMKSMDIEDLLHPSVSK